MTFDFMWDLGIMWDLPMSQIHDSQNLKITQIIPIIIFSHLHAYSNCLCVHLGVTEWAISSCMLPQRYKGPFLPLSHVSNDKMVPISATL